MKWRDIVNKVNIGEERERERGMSVWCMVGRERRDGVGVGGGMDVVVWAGYVVAVDVLSFCFVLPDCRMQSSISRGDLRMRIYIIVVDDGC